MLPESRPYKRYLLRLASKTARWHNEAAWTDARIECYERDIFHAFYTIRRLSESNKLSEALVGRGVRLQAFKPTGERVTLMSRGDLPELYDLEHPIATTRPLIFVCNQVMHSYVFNLFIDERRKTSSFYFSSDRETRRSLYRMTRGTFTSLLKTVGENYPRMASFEYDPSIDDYRARMR